MMSSCSVHKFQNSVRSEDQFSVDGDKMRLDFKLWKSDSVKIDHLPQHRDSIHITLRVFDAENENCEENSFWVRSDRVMRSMVEIFSEKKITLNADPLLRLYMFVHTLTAQPCTTRHRQIRSLNVDVSVVRAEEHDKFQRCMICLDEIDGGYEFLMGCSHTYHGECIYPWLKMHNNCPVCRSEMPAPVTSVLTI